MQLLAIFTPATFMICMVLIGLFAISLLVLAVIRIRTAEKQIRESKSYIYKNITVSATTKPDLQTLYLEDQKTRGSIVVYRKPGQFYCTDYLLEQLISYYDSVDYLTISTDKGSREQTLFLACTLKEDIVYLELSNFLVDIKNLAPKSNYSISDYIVLIDENNQIVNNDRISKVKKVLSVVFVTSELKMVYPTKKGIKDDVMYDMLTQTICGYVPVEEVQPITIYSIVEENGHYYSRPKSVRTRTREPIPQTLDILFGTIKKVIWKGLEISNIPMSKVFNALILGVAELQNIAIFGNRGTLKTTLLDMIAWMLSQNPDHRVYQLTGSIAEQVHSMAFQEFLDRELSDSIDLSDDKFMYSKHGEPIISKNKPKEVGPRKKNFFIIDEGHTLFMKDVPNSAGILQAMDSSLKQQYNLSFIVVYNALKEEMLRDLFRPGRNPFEIYLNPLEEKEARRLLELVDKECDNDTHYVDGDQFERKLEANNDLFGLVLDTPGNLCAGTIFECEKPRAQASLFEQNLEEMDKKYNAKKKKLPPTIDDVESP